MENKELSNCCNAEIKEGICSECLEHCVSIREQEWEETKQKLIGGIKYVQTKDESERIPLHPEKHPTIKEHEEWFKNMSKQMNDPNRGIFSLDLNAE